MSQRTRLRPSSSLQYRSERLAQLGLLALLVALAIAAFEARATVVEIHPLEEMSRRADVIVQARVSDQLVQWEEGRIVTLTELEVIDGIKGAKYGDVLTVYQVGGKLDGVATQINGSSKFTVGEEIVLFAMRHGDRVVTYGVGVGKFLVELDPNDAQVIEPRVVEDFEDIVAARKAPSGALAYEAPEPRTAATLTEFKSALRSYVEAASQPRLKKLELRVKPPMRAIRRGGE